MPEAPQELSAKRTKITNYLLNLEHSEGGSKAKFFISIGFSPDEPQELIRELFWHATAETFKREQQSATGTKYIFEGMIISPDGRNPNIRSVWHRAPGARFAELVTAYPI